MLTITRNHVIVISETRNHVNNKEENNMALVKTFNANDLKEEFKAWGRDYYSYAACEAIIDLFEECDCDKNTELDIVGLCCVFNEEAWEDIIYRSSNFVKICIL